MLNSSLVLFFIQIFLIQAEVINDPTVKPTKDFDACKDADNTFNSTDEKIANIIYHRTFDERKQIEECYNKKYSTQSTYNFVGAIQRTFNSDLNTLNRWALESPEQILADAIHDTISSRCGLMGDIEEVVCANDKQMKDRIDKYYQATYNTTVANDLAKFRPEDKDYQNVMQKYCWVGLCQDKKITPEDADKEAQGLRGIRAKKHKTDFKNKLNELLEKYCEPDMKLIFQKYRHGDNGIEDAVSKAFTCDRQWSAYFQLVKYIEDTCKFYAFELRHAADDSSSIHFDKISRIILTRSERDLFCIQKVYQSQDGYETFTSRLADKMKKSWYVSKSLYAECIRYLMGKP